jgi:peptide deformylase
VSERKILHLGNPALWEKSFPVEAVHSTDTKSLVEDLDDTLSAFIRANGYGRGIAAVQIGVLKRVVFIRMPNNRFSGALINPVIVWEDVDRVELWDACFSLPNLMVRVSRATAIRVEYVDQDGVSQSVDAEGDLAELLQHEIDHLDGILAIERAISPESFSTRAEWERFHSSEA